MVKKKTKKNTLKRKSVRKNRIRKKGGFTPSEELHMRQLQERAFRKLSLLSYAHNFIWTHDEILELINRLNLTELSLLADSNGVQETHNIMRNIFDRLDNE